MITIFLVITISAFICTIAASLSKCPVWVPVLLLCVIEMLRAMPLGR